jgi:hypothetical protein
MKTVMMFALVAAIALCLAVHWLGNRLSKAEVLTSVTKARVTEIEEALK